MIQNDRLLTKHDDSTIINLYHLDLFKSIEYLKKEFADVKVVCMGGKASRMKHLAEELRRKCHDKSNENLIDYSEAGGRYSMFKTHKVIFLSHGMGIPSISIALDEVTKMLHFAGAKEPIYIRVGTCGGLGLNPGTIVLSEKCYSPQLETYLELFVCGKSQKKPAIIDQEIVRQFMESSKKKAGNGMMIVANTLCANTFYEEQARMDGSVCSITEKEKSDFFIRLINEFNIRNIEMESLGFAAFCHTLGIKCLVAAVILVDRMESESITLSHDVIKGFESNLSDAVLDFVVTKIK